MRTMAARLIGKAGPPTTSSASRIPELKRLPKGWETGGGGNSLAVVIRGQACECCVAMMLRMSRVRRRVVNGVT